MVCLQARLRGCLVRWFGGSWIMKMFLSFAGLLKRYPCRNHFKHVAFSTPKSSWTPFTSCNVQVFFICKDPCFSSSFTSWALLADPVAVGALSSAPVHPVPRVDVLERTLLRAAEQAPRDFRRVASKNSSGCGLQNWYHFLAPWMETKHKTCERSSLELYARHITVREGQPAGTTAGSGLRRSL